MNTENGKPKGTKRLKSIDAFRGLTIAGMILVINPGSWKYIYPSLRHANWHGCTIADLVFPFFLFIVGVSITFSLGKAKSHDTQGTGLYLKIIKRTIILFVIGLFLNTFPKFNIADIRIMGVLQRIAICYLIVSIVFIKTEFRTQAIITGALLFIYWAIMEWIPIPNAELGSYEKGKTVATFVDKLILKGHMGYYEKLGEPEGIISTIPALSSTLFGVLTGQYLKLKKGIKKTSITLFLCGLVLAIVGLVWSNSLPINKQLWTSSYATLTTGLALILFSIFYYVIDGIQYQKWTKPLIVFGMNAITVYVLSIILARIIKMLTFVVDDKTYHLRSWMYENYFLGLFGNYGASLVYALLYCVFWCGIMWIFYSRKIFIKV